MLIAENLIKSFYRNIGRGRREEFNAVDGISLKAAPGEIVGILGPNGAGKTTLLRMLSSLMKPTSGKVYVTVSDGMDSERTISDSLEIKRNIGYLSGNTKLHGRLSVRESLEFFAGVYGLPEDKIPARIEEVEKLLDLSEFIDNRIEKLSTGQTQRASISRCIVHDPEIYIFDEPTLGLIICKSRDSVKARYALEASSQPMGIAVYDINRFLPEDYRSSLPTIEEIEAELADEVEGGQDA